MDSLVDDLRASRSRLAAARDEERRRVERDLHDGAQQELAAVKMKLSIAESLLMSDPAAGAQMLTQAVGDLDGAIGQLRAARTWHLSAAAGERRRRRGAASRRAPGVAAHLGERGRRRTRAARDAENAVYFCCLEAMHNADKHAGEGAHVAVRLWRDGGLLRFSVTDDGGGFEHADATGAGLVNMRDRVESLGGRLDIESTPGRGTRVAGHVPAG